MQARNEASYRHRPISTLAALARHLGVSIEALQAVRLAAPNSYTAKERPKRDGGVRVTHSVAKPLKDMQARILHRLLRRVELPDYLLGGRPGKDYLANVQYHCGANILFGEDVASFYPSIRNLHIHRIFQYLMRFPPVVSDCLTEMCTYQDAVPQGASTSGDLANLVLWRTEPALVTRFAERGLRYSRFVDDVYVSARRLVAPDEKTWIVAQLHRFLVLEGFRVKRKKHELKSSGDAMRVHRIGINAGRPTISASERAKLRAAVREVEMSWKNLSRLEKITATNKLRGRIARLKNLHHVQYRQLVLRVGTMLERIASNNC